MKQKMTVLIALATALLLASCAGLMGPRTVDIPLSTLQQHLAGKFPFNSRYLELFDIHLSNPKLALQPETNRVITTVDANVLPTFFGKAWNGSFVLSGKLDVDPEKRALVLADPRIENINLDGLDARYARQMTKLGSFLAEEVLRNVPLYTFTEDKFRYGGTSFMPSKITTRNNGLVVTFEPVK